MTISWTSKQKKMAKEKGLHLVKVQLQGKHAATGPRGNTEVSGVIGPEQAVRLYALLNEMCVKVE